MSLKSNRYYVNLVLSQLNGPVYFYYCQNIGDDNKCNLSGNKTHLCNFPASVTTLLPQECGFREWQKQALTKINDEISRDILIKIKELNEYRLKSFQCKRTGTCCRLASSEFSYEDLKYKAQNNDKFAKQFTSIFIPYKSIDEARQVFPEYVDMALKQLGDDEELYFYHCPKVTDDNLCSIYDDRPEICREFPNNPLAILPLNCGFKEWKEDVMVAAMLLHALVQITEFYHEKIEIALRD